MLTPLLLGLGLLRTVSQPARILPQPSAHDVVILQDGSEVDAKIAAAGKDVSKLLDLASSLAGGNQADAAAKVYKRVLELDPENKVAHEGLRHQFYDNKWFESFAELSKYKREEAARMKEKGLARFKDEWVPEADVPYLNMGWVREGNGPWRNPVDIAREKEIAQREAEGYRFRADDSSWVAPADVDKWAAVLWKCGDEWVDMAKANEFHAVPEQAWVLTGERFVVETTIDWDGANLARWHADKSYDDLVRLFGVEPRSKPRIVVLNSIAQYNAGAGNNPILPEFAGLSSLHGAYFADLCFDTEAKPPQFVGCGVSYWDRKDPNAGSWGALWVRWAAAQSFADAVDPSWAAIGDRIAGGESVEDAAFAAAFWSEKKIPRWLRYGAASYVERYGKNPEAAEGTDPYGLRAFAFDELKKAGGLRKLADVFAFKLDVNDIPGSMRLCGEAGLLVAYLLDGAAADKELAETHQAVKAALKSGTKADAAAAAAAAAALQQELEKHDAKIRTFAGL